MQNLEPRLARAFGAGLGVAMAFLALGLVFRPALWAGILTLALVPPVGAAMAWRGADRETRVSIVLSSLGVVAAIGIGLLLRR
jgi:predicted PurR-regulated permease PerM